MLYQNLYTDLFPKACLFDIDKQAFGIAICSLKNADLLQKIE